MKFPLRMKSGSGWAVDVQRVTDSSSAPVLVRIVPERLVNNRLLEWGACSLFTFVGLGFSEGLIFGGLVFHSILSGILFPVVFMLLGVGVQSFCRTRRDHPDGEHQSWTHRDNTKGKMTAAAALFGRIGPTFDEFPVHLVKAFDELTSVDTDQTSKFLVALLADELYADDVLDIIYRLASTENKNAFVLARTALGELYRTKLADDKKREELEEQEAKWRAEVNEALERHDREVAEELLAVQPDYADDFATLVEKHQHGYDPATYLVAITGTPNQSLNHNQAITTHRGE